MDALDNARGGHAHGVMPPPLPADYGKPPAPVPPGARNPTPDVLRGTALLGILCANMINFSQPFDEVGLHSGLWLGWPDRPTDWVSMLLVEGKFYPLFSFLFGLGFAMQTDRSNTRGTGFKTVHVRRLLTLMGIGLAHGIFIWDGDVLFAYGVGGFLLMLFRNRKPLTIAIWSAALVILPALVYMTVGLMFFVLSHHPELAGLLKEVNHETYSGTRGEFHVNMDGSYMDVVFNRVRELVSTTLFMLSAVPSFLGLFLIGMLAGRAKIITEAENHKTLLRRIAGVCGVVGLAGNFLSASLMMKSYEQENMGFVAISVGVLSIVGPVLTAAYISGMALLLQMKPKLAAFPPLAAAGRMALTNYLAQSLIATTLFYGYGLGLGGEVGRLGTILIAVLVFSLQLVFSVLWLRRFQYGPMEWLWRSLTYMKRQPMLRTDA